MKRMRMDRMLETGKEEARQVRDGKVVNLV